MLKNHMPETEDVGKMLANPQDLGTRLEGFEPTTPGSEDRYSIRWATGARIQIQSYLMMAFSATARAFN